MFSNCRAQLTLCKGSASERNEHLFSDCRAQLTLCKGSGFILIYVIHFSKKSPFFSHPAPIARQKSPFHRVIGAESQRHSAPFATPFSPYCTGVGWLPWRASPAIGGKVRGLGHAPRLPSPTEAKAERDTFAEPRQKGEAGVYEGIGEILARTAQMKWMPADNMKDQLWGKRGTPEREAMEAQLKEDVNAYYGC